MSDEIDDKSLIIWLKNNYKYIEFIKYEPENKRNDRFKILKRSITNLKPAKPLFEQKEILKIIWKELVATAVIFLKSKDEREFFHDDGDYGIDDLHVFFQKFCEFEKLLYGSGDHYRDHVSHVFKVFLLGEKLVKEKLGGFSLIDVMDNKLRQDGDSKLITDDEKEAMWCIASLTHDLGYPTEHVNKIHNSLRDMLNVFNIQDVSYILSHQSQLFNDSIIKLISSDLKLIDEDKTDEKKRQYITHTQAKFYFKYSRSIEKWDHGVESCIILVKSLVYFLETDYGIDERKPLDIDEARQFLIRQRILRAIASHNCDFIYHLKLDLSFLLKIIDEMQEWGRPKLNDLFIKPPKVIFSIDEFKIDESKKSKIEYSIRFSLEDVNPSEEDKKELHKNIKEFFKKNVKKYIMILRSAVGGIERADDKLVLTVNVIDEIETELKYTFIHNTPQNIILIINNKKIALKDLESY
ncbi:Uncharacterised protein [uncultured archaeon]|nr:Uncharacterised protein [uncultured archaeon]